MQARNVGTSPLQVSVIGMGCNNFSRPGTATRDLAESVRVIHAAIDHGITFFDGADIYGGSPGQSEEFLGEALRGRRDRVVLATKFGHQDYPMPGAEAWGPKGAAHYVRAAVDASLQRLRTDHIDLLQMHTPDPQTPIEHTLAVLTELIREGKVRHIGHSNFTADQAREAARVSLAGGYESFISAQNEYSLLARGIEHDLLPTAVELGLGVFPYYPLANGLLTGKYTADGGGEGRMRTIKAAQLAGVDWGLLDRYRRLCDLAGLTMLEVTIQWLLRQPGISSVIAGTTRVEQVVQNAAAGNAVVPAEVLEAVDRLFAP